MLLQPGDQILFGKWAGSDFEFDGEKYQMMKQSDICAVIK
jgi:chaperonin GroES